MNSRELTRWGIGQWYPITSYNVPKVVAILPDNPGVYVFRTLDMKARVQGESDIAHVGKGTRSTGVRARVREHFYKRALPTTSTPSGRIDQWINAWGYDVEVGWLVRASEELAEAVEREILEAYEKDHHDRPPINRSMPRG